MRRLQKSECRSEGFQESRHLEVRVPEDRWVEAGCWVSSWQSYLYWVVVQGSHVVKHLRQQEHLELCRKGEAAEAA